MAQTAAGGGGSGQVFMSSLAEFQGLSACLTGEESTATSAAKAQVLLLVLYDCKNPWGTSPMSHFLQIFSRM